jgi:hypothetical protein
MAQEEEFRADPDTVFQACINAVAYTNWAIQSRDGDQLILDVKTPFTMKEYSPTFQDRIDVEVIPLDDGATVWVDSNPRFQLWNWGKDKRNENKFLDEVAREVRTIARRRGPPRGERRTADDHRGDTTRRSDGSRRRS